MQAIEQQVYLHSQSIPMTTLLDLEAEQQAAARSNFLLRVSRYAQRRILLCTRHCPVCFKATDALVQGLRPLICNDAFCQHRAESIGLVCDVAAEIRKARERVDALDDELAQCYERWEELEELDS